MKQKLPRSIKKLPKYGEGIDFITRNQSGKLQFGEDVGGNAGVSTALSTASTLTSLLPDKKVVDSQGNYIGSRPSTGETVASQALKGAAAGAMFGPWGAAGGAAIYGTIGAIQADREKRELLRAKRKSDMMFNRANFFEGSSFKNTMSGDVQTNTQPFYAHGGNYPNTLFPVTDTSLQSHIIPNFEMGGYNDFANYPTTSLPVMSAPNTAKKRSIAKFINGGYGTPNAEIETDELVQTPGEYPQAFDGGKLRQANSNTFEADGQTHDEVNENGISGIETELPTGSRIFSDRIKHNGRTIASIVSPISKKIGKLEERLEVSPSKALENTINLLKNQEDFYFNKQEEIKKDQEAARTLRSFMKGGYKEC